MKYLIDQNVEFDYLLRTNLSSFFVYPRLLECLRQYPRQRCYVGHCIPNNPINSNTFVSGAGFILSRDLVEMIAVESSHVIGNHFDNDDVVIGRFLRDRRVVPIHLPQEMILNWKQWLEKKAHLETGIHFRVRNFEGFFRERTEPLIHKYLRDFFYGNLTSQNP